MHYRSFFLFSVIFLPCISIKGIVQFTILIFFAFVCATHQSSSSSSTHHLIFHQHIKNIRIFKRTTVTFTFTPVPSSISRRSGSMSIKIIVIVIIKPPTLRTAHSSNSTRIAQLIIIIHTH